MLWNHENRFSKAKRYKIYLINFEDDLKITIFLLHDCVLCLRNVNAVSKCTLFASERILEDFVWLSQSFCIMLDSFRMVSNKKNAFIMSNFSSMTTLMKFFSLT